MQIRPATIEEFDEVGQITLEAYLGVFGGRGVGDYRDELLDVAARADAGTVLVALDDAGRPVGSVTFVPGPDTKMSEFVDVDGCGIRMLAVRPSRQGSGVGRALTEACLELARAEGRRLVILHSTEAMQVARTMYERIGFVRTPERDVRIDAEGFDEPFTLMAYVFELS